VPEADHSGRTEVKDALYYPYIHFRDETWLRSSLLFFPHILRMAPKEYAFRDSDFIRELMETEGAWGQPLVTTYPLDSPQAYFAANRLAERFAKDLQDQSFVSQLDRQATIDQFGDDEIFQIHRSKFSYTLQNALFEKGLIWSPRRGHRGASWLAVHPKVGELVMSTAASSAANDRGCAVVTDNADTHVLASQLSEAELYQAILFDDARLKPTEAVSGQEIGELVISMTFDLTEVTPSDFAALSKDREGLQSFSELLAEEAKRIPRIADKTARDARVRAAAERIIDDWENRKRSFGPYLKSLFRLDSLDEAKGMATDALQYGFFGGAAGATLGGTILGAVPGLAIGLIAHGANSWRDAGLEETQSATHFLTKVSKHGGLITASEH